MKVHVVLSAEGKRPLFADGALMVFLHEDDAREELEGLKLSTLGQPEDGFVKVVSADKITQELEDGRVERVRVVLASDEHYGAGLEEWRELVEAVDAQIEERANKFIIDMIDDGLIGYDAEADLLYHKGVDEE